MDQDKFLGVHTVGPARHDSRVVGGSDFVENLNLRFGNFCVLKCNSQFSDGNAECMISHPDESRLTGSAFPGLTRNSVSADAAPQVDTVSHPSSTRTHVQCDIAPNFTFVVPLKQGELTMGLRIG